MCGIAGIFNVDRSKEFDQAKLARALLLAIEQRGRHATGYAYIQDETTIVDKADMPARDFVEAARIFTDGFESTPRALLLHTRYATQGAPANNYNNHPIHSKATGLTLIHNGWLTNEREILRNFNLRKDGEVDSETILRLIEHFVVNERKRIITAIKLAMRELEGVFACGLISEKYPDTLWLWRSGNPIACYRDIETGAFIFASTQELLVRALRDGGWADPEELLAFPQDHVACLRAVKGELHGSFKKLRKHRKPKKEKPITKQQPLIAVPRSLEPNLVENAPKLDLRGTGQAADKAWELWKEQGKKINAILRRRDGKTTRIN